MSAQTLPAALETTAETADVVARRLTRALDYADGFWLGFVRCNVPAQRRRVVAHLIALLDALQIHVVEVDLAGPVEELLPLLKTRLDEAQAQSGGPSAPARRKKIALFLYGLERSIPSADAYPRILSYLNLNRERFLQVLPCPLTIWLPDYALTALARRAPDFWAWRSGLYELEAERVTAERALSPITSEAAHVMGSLPERAKRERLVMLKGLLEEYRALGGSPRERSRQAQILNEMGLVHEALSDWVEARRLYEESLAISRALGDQAGIATTLGNLGTLAWETGDWVEARRLYEESLAIRRPLGDQAGIAGTLNNLGLLARETGELAEARRFYEESLAIFRALGDQADIATTLGNLGNLARGTGELAEARRLYEESLAISRALGDQAGIATTLGDLGNLARGTGELAEARRLFEESLAIRRPLGDQAGIAKMLNNLGILAQETGDIAEARRL
ncbi:MAG: tetratricopeptide repeat protein, partial [Acidobacteria bacterium]|nr:tetratricopeptide repeat protein [Acidobacteriota bacterium]